MFRTTVAASTRHKQPIPPHNFAGELLREFKVRIVHTAAAGKTDINLSIRCKPLFSEMLKIDDVEFITRHRMIEMRKYFLTLMAG